MNLITRQNWESISAYPIRLVCIIIRYLHKLYSTSKNIQTMKLGIGLKKLRKKVGYSQEYVASRLEMSQANYCRIEQDTLHITHDKLEIIAQIYSISLAQLFDEKFNIFTSEEDSEPKENIQISLDDLLKLKEQVIEVQHRHIQLLEEKLQSFKS
jgi:transcriptional regulator with XRE-family HTH domain